MKCPWKLTLSRCSLPRLQSRGLARSNGSKKSFYFCLALSLLIAGLGYAQEVEIAKYPNRPITFIVPTSPGAAGDLPCRLIAKEAEKLLGQPIVILNKPGGSFTIGIAAIAVSKPDGYTIGYAGHPGMFVPPLTERVPYHPVRDLKQIMQFGDLIIAIFVKGDSPFKSFEDVVAYARENPKKLTYGSAGIGSFGYLAMEQIGKKEKVQFTHIPFKGSPETEAALLGGHILVGTGGPRYSLLEAGQIRLLLLIAEKHSTEYPQTPILKDLGYDIPAPMFLNVAGPKGIPDGIVKKLEDAFTKAMKEPAFIKGMKDLRISIVHRKSQELGDYVAQNYDLFEKLLKEIEITK
jgi:tripartite-type tricarboxylate transporter receptor subunit TctC